MINLEQKTYKEINKELAGRLAMLRKRKGLSQSALASKAGVSFGSLKRFEQTGEISLQSFTKLMLALGTEDELEGLLTAVPFSSIEEVINGQS